MLGPNGAGKSTLVRAVATLLRPDAGRLRVAGIDAARHPEQVRAVIGLAGQFAAVEPAMTGRENLVDGGPPVRARPPVGPGRGRRGARASSASRTRPTAWSAATRAACAAGSTSAPASSAGPACCCSTSRPPASTPAAASSCGRPIRALVRSGTDVLLTTQYLDEADQLADHITIVDHGRAIASGTPEELKGMAGRDVIEIRVRRPDDLGARRVESSRGVGDDDVRIDRADPPGHGRGRSRPRGPGRPRCASSPAVASRSTTSASAGPPSTRCSSPSPAGPPPTPPDHHHPHDRSHHVRHHPPLQRHVDRATACRRPARTAGRPRAPPRPRSPGARCASSGARRS